MRRFIVSAFGMCLLLGCANQGENAGHYYFSFGWTIKVGQESPDGTFRSEINLLPELWERIGKDAEEVVD